MAIKKEKLTSKSSRESKFIKKEALSFGFDLAKKNLFFFVILFVIVMLVSGIVSIFKGLAANEPAFGFVLWLLQMIVNSVIGIGLINITLKFIDKKKPVYKDLFYYKPIVNYFGATIVQSLIVLGGFILLIIPGIVFAIRLQFATYLVVDKNMAPIDAIKKSWEMTRGSVWNLFFFGILLCLVNLLGALCLLIGLFITVPLTMLATTYVYRKLLNV